ncbi:hypothetical protein [Streptomyces sp. NPDC058664]|uniref:hypothetical protein n=1 Tax=unclassified Streptomyces TaxID=2593676 RepID=UPI00365F3A3C
MERIYMNRRTGEQRIHVEITSSEVSDLLDDLQANPEHYDSTSGFLVILHGAEETFSPVVAEGRRDRAARTASGQQPETVPTPEEGIEDARKAIQHVLQLFLDRVPRNELDAETMADSLTDALSDGLTELYRSLAQAETALAAVGQPAEAQATDEAPLTAAERQFLKFALDLAFDAMVSGDGFTDEDDAAMARLRLMAKEARS